MKTFIYKNLPNDKHITGHGHPESPERMATLEDLFTESPFNEWLQERGYPGSFEQLTLAHTPDYINSIVDQTPDEGLHYLDSDTVLCPTSYECALASVGTVCTALNDIMENSKTRAFCAVRPPGHHANADTAMGFCLFNNVFIAARYAQETFDLKKIAIVDIDVHHGNGTQDLTKAHNAKNPDSPILYCSSHGAPMWPMTGDLKDNDAFTCNAPLSLEADSEEFRTAYNDTILPALNDFEPELIIISAGFDAHKDDPLASLNLIEEDFNWVTRQLSTIANAHSDGCILSVLEGGYNLKALQNSVRMHLLALNDD